MISTSEPVSYELSRTHPKLKGIVIDADVLSDLKFDMCRARQTKQGQTVEQNPVDLFMYDIKKWLEQSNRDKGKNTSWVQMKAALELKYPTRYDLSTEQHVKHAMNALTTGKTDPESIVRSGCPRFRKV